MDAMPPKHTTTLRPHATRAAQSGQAIVLIALMMVGLIGFTGLALDGGSLLFLQRKAQTVAEMASMSAAVMACDNGAATDDQLQARAIQVAGSPGNDIDDSMVEAQVQRAGTWTDVAVTVTLPKPAYFIQVVYKGELIAEGHSVARCSGDAASVANPYADAVLFATAEDCEDTLFTEGNGMTYGGSLRSNDEVRLDASSGGPGSAATVTITGTVNYVKEATGNRAWNYLESPERYGGYYSMSIAGRPTPNLRDASDTSDEGILQGPVQPAPLLYEIDDFRPGGAIWNSIPENRRTYIPPEVAAINGLLWTGVCSNPDVCNVIPPRDGKIQGLYFVDGNFLITGTGTIMNAMIGDGITIVATGRINVTGPAFHMVPYYDNLQMMSGYGAPGDYRDFDAGTSITTGGDCGSDGSQSTHAIGLHGGGNQNTVVFGTAARPGLLYAPWGKVYIGTGDAGPSHGQIIAYTISSHQGNAAVYYGPTASAMSTLTTPLDVYFTQ